MTDPFKSDDTLLSRSDILEKAREYAQWAEEMNTLVKKRKERREWFYLVAKVIGADAARELIGDLADPEVREDAPVKSRPRIGGVTWTGVIEEYVKTANRAVPYAELKAAISHTVLGSKLEKTDKSFYSAIDKLISRNALVRKEGHLFTVEAFYEYERKVAAGEVEEVQKTPSGNHFSPLMDAVLEFVLSQPQGVTGRQIVDHIIGIERFRSSVERHNTSVYNPLKRLVDRNLIRKEGASYFPATETESGGSDEETAA